MFQFDLIERSYGEGSSSSNGDTNTQSNINRHYSLMLQVHNEGFFDNAIYDNDNEYESSDDDDDDDDDDGDGEGLEEYFGKNFFYNTVDFRLFELPLFEQNLSRHQFSL